MNVFVRVIGVDNKIDFYIMVLSWVECGLNNLGIKIS